MPRNASSIAPVVKYTEWLFTAHVGNAYDVLMSDRVVYDFGHAELLNPNHVYMANRVNYLVYQLEKAPTTGSYHFQGFLQFKCPVSMMQVKSHLKDAHFKYHLCPVHTTPIRALYYAQKLDTRIKGPFEYGKFSIPNKIA